MARPSARLALLLAAIVALPAAALPLLPESQRPFNFAAFGAVLLFAAARGGRWGWAAGLVLGLGAKTLSDLLSWRQHDFDPAYLPSPTILVCLAVYAVAGLTVRRRSGWWGVPAGLAGGVGFFLVTNALSWWGMALPYDRSLAGLLDAYRMGLPFARGTFVGDALFTGGLFATHAALVWAIRPAAVAAPVRS